MHPDPDLTHSLESRTGNALAGGLAGSDAAPVASRGSQQEPPNRADSAPLEPAPPPASVAPAGAPAPLLSETHRERISELFEHLSELSHFELLGVERTADRKAIKDAYYSQVAAYHPDSYFGIELGSIQHKMESVFQRLTEAHDTLCRKKSRAEYEAYLSAREATRAPAPAPSDETSLQEMERLLSLAMAEARESPAPATRVGGIPGPPPLPSRPPTSTSSPPTRGVRLDPQQRRRALARKLGRSLAPPAAERAPSEPARAEKSAAARARFRELHEQRLESAREQRLEHFLQTAQTCLEADKPISAANALQSASVAADNQPEALARIAALEATVNRQLAEAYTSQARYEESNGQYLQAAISYTRASTAEPEPDILKRAAECYVRAGQELRRAAEMARRAVELDPNRSDIRMTLARVYQAAGMNQSAISELERCLQLNPNSDRIKQWLKRIRSECV